MWPRTRLLPPHAATAEATGSGAWEPLLRPGLALLSGRSGDLRAFHHELAHYAIHHRPGHVLWCDGTHAFNPYDYAEINLTSGLAADDGAERLLVKRCMTPFQWDSVLTQHLDQKLSEVEAALVLVAPYDALFSTDELKDWEQEDYVRYSLRHLAGLAERFAVPLLLSVDLPRWWHTHPVLAQMAAAATEPAGEGKRRQPGGAAAPKARWTLTAPGGRFRVAEEGTGRVLDPSLRATVTLLDYVEEQVVELEAASRRQVRSATYK